MKTNRGVVIRGILLLGGLVILTAFPFWLPWKSLDAFLSDPAGTRITDRTGTLLSVVSGPGGSSVRSWTSRISPAAAATFSSGWRTPGSTAIPGLTRLPWGAHSFCAPAGKRGAVGRINDHDAACPNRLPSCAQLPREAPRGFSRPRAGIETFQGTDPLALPELRSFREEYARGRGRGMDILRDRPCRPFLRADPGARGDSPKPLPLRSLRSPRDSSRQSR